MQDLSRPRRGRDGRYARPRRADRANSGRGRLLAGDLCARLHEVKEAGLRLAGYGSSVMARRVDVSDPVAVNANSSNEVESHFGRIDILVNNAGIIQAGPLENMTLSRFSRDPGDRLLGRRLCVDGGAAGDAAPQERHHLQHHVDRRRSVGATSAAVFVREGGGARVLRRADRRARRLAACAR